MADDRALALAMRRRDQRRLDYDDFEDAELELEEAEA
jgi:hypothetical protein